MAVSLYDLSVVNYLQTLGGMEGFLAKGLTHFQGSKADPNAILDERLHADMLPFKFQAREALQQVKAADVDAVQGKDVTFQLPTMKIPFTAEGFLLSFSLPNFYFHATTAYDILRHKGVPLGKRDFLGRMRIKS